MIALLGEHDKKLRVSQEENCRSSVLDCVGADLQRRCGGRAHMKAHRLINAVGHPVRSIQLVTRVSLYRTPLLE